MQVPKWLLTQITFKIKFYLIQNTFVSKSCICDSEVIPESNHHEYPVYSVLSNDKIRLYIEIKNT